MCISLIKKQKISISGIITDAAAVSYRSLGGFGGGGRERKN